jgi:predicted peroxiredoxin
MSRYLFIQSQDPFTEARTQAQYELAGSLAANGHEVRMLLVQNGVLAARRNAASISFNRLCGTGVILLADTLSLQQREIDQADLKPAVNPAEFGIFIEAMLKGDKVIWN